jgi:hypothetical protein
MLQTAGRPHHRAERARRGAARPALPGEGGREGPPLKEVL